MGGLNRNGSYGDWLEGVDWIRLAQDRDRWRALMNTVMNLRVLAPRSTTVRRMHMECPYIPLRIMLATQQYALGGNACKCAQAESSCCKCSYSSSYTCASHQTVEALLFVAKGFATDRSTAARTDVMLYTRRCVHNIRHIHG
jgi:hypothetical protein